MQHYGTCDATPLDGARAEKHMDHILRKYPELLVALNCRSKYGRRKRRRTLRKDSELVRRCKRNREMPSVRFKELESALLDAMDETKSATLLFSCPMCRSVLRGPVTVECGHTFCGSCLERTVDPVCVVCAGDIGTARCTNVLVQQLIEKWQERNRGFTSDHRSVPNTADILGIEPRYVLRSRLAGLQVNEAKECQFSSMTIKTVNVSNERFNTTVRNAFKEAEDIRQRAIKSYWDSVSADDLECILCSRFILDPVTTACGHTFCKGCLTRVLDHGLSCPLCMSTLTLRDYSRGCNIVLDQAIRFLLPQHFSERALVDAKEVQMLTNNCDLSVFVCTNAFPGVACPLYVYEPRYRLLVRRCLLSPTRRFAMAAKDGSRDKFVSYGTVLEVKDAVFMEDGSFILTTVGVGRFKVISRGEKDGYDTARIQFIKDTAVAVDKLPELLTLHQKVYKKASNWISSLTPKILAEVERLIGQMPKPEKNCLDLPDGPLWTWWLMPILPLNSQLQVGFLSTTNLEKRLRAIDKMLERMEIRMSRSLERSTLKYSTSEDVNNESCSDSERTFERTFEFNANTN